MRKLFENIRLALSAIRANKMRSMLTTLGIVIGVMAVIAVVSIVQGLSFFFGTMLQDLSADVIWASPHRPPGDRGEELGRIEMTYEDGLAVEKYCPDVSVVSPYIQVPNRQVKYGEKKTNTILVATTAPYQEINSHFVDRGRFFSDIDQEHRKRVCVVGTKVLENLEVTGDVLDKKIKISGHPFKIIGVMEEKGDVLGQSQNDFVIIPITGAPQLLGQFWLKNVILQIRARNIERIDEAKEQITEVLRRQHGLSGDQSNDFQLMTQGEFLEMFEKVMTGTTAVVGGIVGISLLVGGIGIMNIMLVSVTERTREIGVRKAVGAKNHDILIQFLVEAVTLSCVGGLLGVLSGYGVGLLGSTIIGKWIPDWPPAHVPLWAIVLAFAFSAGVGIFFGIYPAGKASRLDPIDALRYE